jgi:membrane protease YdiL (CAAX protease family)
MSSRMTVNYDLPTITLFALVAAMPALGFAAYRRIRSGKPLQPVRARMLTSIGLLIILSVFGLEAAASNHIHLDPKIPAGAAVFGTCFLAILIFGVRRAIKLHPERSAKARRLFGTSNPSELTWAMILAVAAGVGEELVFRGVLYQLLLRQFGNAVLVVAICVALFAFGHAAQGWRGILFSGYLALCFHLVVLVWASIVTVMIVHTLYDAALFAMLYRRGVPESNGEAVAQSA